MFAIVNVQFSSGLIEMQNEKEKHGKFILTSTYFLFVVESPIDFMLNVSKCWWKIEIHKRIHVKRWQFVVTIFVVVSNTNKTQKSKWKKE